MRTRRIPLPGPIDLGRTLRLAWRGPGDPTMRIGRGLMWRAARNEDGPACLRIEPEPGGVRAFAWGPGAERALELAPDLVGANDDVSGFEPRHPLVLDLHRRLGGMRIGRTNAVVQALIPSVIEQKINGKEARRIYARLVRSCGEPAPGPAGLLLPPEPERLAALPYHAFHGFGLERRRAETIRLVCSREARLERTAALEPSGARAVLRTLPGVGYWTAAEVSAVAYGDPDAVSVGDFHIPHLVSWALAGEPRGTDQRMLELLEPYRGHRGRVIRLLEAGGPRPPRFGPRLEAWSIRGL